MNGNWSKSLELLESTLQPLPEGTCLECGGNGFVRTDVAPNRVWVGDYLGRGEWIDVYAHEICPKCHGICEIQSPDVVEYREIGSNVVKKIC